MPIREIERLLSFALVGPKPLAMKRTALLLAVLFYSQISFAQFTILGTVTGEDDNPLPGAYVYVANTNLGTSSNASGVYKLELKEGTYTLVVDYIGYKETIDTVQVSSDLSINYRLEISPFLTDEFVVEATRVGLNAPFTHENVKKQQLEAVNFGQDLPILLNQSVSMVTTSDAGAGVGYTGMRIRGSDATRINVTVNGVPLNDAESHGVFWVNMPDFSSTTDNIQIQRGVGTSSNGAASFGASVNLQTTGFDSSTFVEINNSYGSFNTHRHNIVYNSGLVSKHLNFEGRLSYIGSDGYIDRSASSLRSYYVSGGYYRKKMMIKGVIFHGKELTQQAWWGTPESRLKNDDPAMLIHAANNGLDPDQTENLLRSGRTYNYYTYANEVDNYAQSHYQLISGYQLTTDLHMNVTGHFTRGLGYFEQSKSDEDYADYGLDYPVIGVDTLRNTDVIVRRWLDNHFYGGVYSLQYTPGKLNITLGGSYNEYIGEHYGEIIWSEVALNTEIGEQYYFSESKKSDISNYLKAQYRLGNVQFYADMQYRYIEYNSQGIDNDQRPIAINRHYNFINPKIGASWRINQSQFAYFSAARASREPVRSDFTDASPGVIPQPEYLTNLEVGWQYRQQRFTFKANGYYMLYKDQLVLTGEVNDVGAPIRTNVDESYRAGLELIAKLDLGHGLYWSPNLALSTNKISEFNETVIDYTNGYDVIYVNHQNTDIAFSPWLVAGSEIGYSSKVGVRVALRTKIVGKQYLDNTSNDARAIDPYWTNDVVLSYSIPSNHWKDLELSVMVNNILDHQYVSNGYTYGYIYGDLITENFYYPQAGVNWMASVKWRF